MTTQTAVQQMDLLFQQTETIRNQYAVALENAKQEVIEITEAIADGESHVQSLYKHYVLNIISLDAYQQEKKVLDDKKASLLFAEQKIKDIADLLNGELYEVYQQMKAINKDYARENNKNYAEQRKKLFTAKVDYLNAIRDGKTEIEKTKKYSRMIDRLRVEIGDKNDIDYDMGDSVVSGLLRNDYNSRAGLDVLPDEIKQAYHKGVIARNVKEQAK